MRTDLHSDTRDREEGEGLLPQQYYDIIAGRRRPNGVRDLMIAVLEDAIRAYVTNRPGRTTRQRRMFEEVKTWIETRGDIAPFSFETICETFDIEPDELRRRLKTLSPEKLPARLRSAKRPNVPTAA